jgi:hypothetical protein
LEELGRPDSRENDNNGGRESSEEDREGGQWEEGEERCQFASDRKKDKRDHSRAIVKQETESQNKYMQYETWSITWIDLNNISKLTVRTSLAHIFSARFTTDEVKLVLGKMIILSHNSWVPIAWWWATTAHKEAFKVNEDSKTFVQDRIGMYLPIITIQFCMLLGACLLELSSPPICYFYIVRIIFRRTVAVRCISDTSQNKAETPIWHIPVSFQ